MNFQISDALSKLRDAGAQKLPKPETMEKAANGKVWSGKKSDGGLWTLKKNNSESFNCTG